MPSESSDAPRQNDNKPRNPQDTAKQKNPGGRPPSPVKPTPEDKAKLCCCHYQPSPRWIRWLEVLGIVSAIAYAVITWFMWRDSHKNFVVDEQAFLPIAAQFPSPIVKGTPFGAFIFLKNQGKTAAKNFDGTFVIAIFRNNEPVSLNYSINYTIENSHYFIPIIYAGPPGDVSWEIDRKVDDFTKATLTEDQASDLVSGRTYMAVYGKATYFDIFGNRRWLRICAFRGYNDRATYWTRSCVKYNDTGDGNPPKE